ncbi:MAG: hypothetical protein KF706_11405 [Chitinophagales bacterium]|nr:hypothetical protein [Chitinophagales bacterium]
MRRFLLGNLLLVSSLLSCNLFGQFTPEVWDTTITGSKIAVDTVLRLQDDKYLSPQWSSLQNLRVSNYVIFEVTDNPAVEYPDSFECDLGVEVTITDANGDSVTLLRTLSISYNARIGAKDVRQAIYSVTGGHILKVKITSISCTEPDVLATLKLTARIEIERQYPLVCDTGVIGWPGYDAINDEYLIYVINFDITADEIELEWTFYDDSSLLVRQNIGSIGNLYQGKNFHNNATRVTVPGAIYRIPLLYEKGYLLFRLRAVHYDHATGGKVNGPWTTDFYPNNPAYVYAVGGHEKGLNWQSATSFAEEGKRKSVISYFDGNAKNRQTVTKNNTDNFTIVKEDVFDHEGRPFMSVLPAPTINSIIRYYENFNLNSSNTPYHWSDADIGGCGAGPEPMSTDSGASRYYSPQNPERNTGIHKNIPDAFGYPFAQTDFMADNTGRPRITAGPGKDHRMGQHVTSHLYGTPYISDLKRLFGNEVGNISHYFKNAVIDPNGQVSINYLDMHGRTIATAMAGYPVNQDLKLLESNRGDTVYRDVMIDSTNQIIDGRSIVFSKKIVVTSPGNHHFDYKLTPEDFTFKTCDSTQFCYDCVYDMELTITDNCGNSSLPGDTNIKKLFQNYTLAQDTAGYDTLCSNPSASIEDTFTVFLNPGAYTITKKLTIKNEALQYYFNHYVRSDTCIKSFQEFLDEELATVGGTNCPVTCEDCLAQLDSVTFMTTFLASIVSDNISIDPDFIPSTYDTANAVTAYLELKENCKLLCDSFSVCDTKLQLLLYDVSPGDGQYAQYNLDPETQVYTSSDVLSVLNATSQLRVPNAPAYKYPHSPYVDALGIPDTLYIDGVYVTPEKLPLDTFIMYWKPSWAKSLVRYHPEYCLYDFCIDNEASHFYDQLMISTSSYDSALVKGLLNPLNSLPSGISLPANPDFQDPFWTTLHGVPERNRFIDSIFNYYGHWDTSIWHLASYMTGCQVPTCNDCDKNYYWIAYRSLYLGMKKRFFDNIVSGLDCFNDSIAASGMGHYTPKERRFENLNTLPLMNDYGDTVATLAVANQQLQDAFQTQCESYAHYWWQQLEGCGLYAPTDSMAIINEFIAVCRLGTDIDHPFGASTTPSISITTANGNYSFEKVLQWYSLTHAYMNYESDGCSHLLISAPFPYHQEVVYNQTAYITRPDTCTCNKISEKHAEYIQKGVGGESFSQYLFRVYTAQITDQELEAVMNICTDASCHFLPDGITIPYQLQCLNCVSCNEVIKAYRALYQKFPEVNNSPNYMNLFANFLNTELGLNLTTYDYLVFLQDSCHFNKVKGNEDTIPQTIPGCTPPLAFTDYTVSGSNGDCPASVCVLLNDDNASGGAITIIDAPSLGDATVNGSGCITYEAYPLFMTFTTGGGGGGGGGSPTLPNFRMDTITYAVCNYCGLCDTAKVIVLVMNEGCNDSFPIAYNDVVTLCALQEDTINVLTNDINPATGGFLLTLVSAPLLDGATVQISGDSTMIIYSAGSSSGTDVIQYVVCNNQACSIGTLTVTVQSCMAPMAMMTDMIEQFKKDIIAKMPAPSLIASARTDMARLVGKERTASGIKTPLFEKLRAKNPFRNMAEVDNHTSLKRERISLPQNFTLFGKPAPTNNSKPTKSNVSLIKLDFSKVFSGKSKGTQKQLAGIFAHLPSMASFTTRPAARAKSDWSELTLMQVKGEQEAKEYKLKMLAQSKASFENYLKHIEEQKIEEQKRIGKREENDSSGFSMATIVNPKLKGLLMNEQMQFTNQQLDIKSLINTISKGEGYGKNNQGKPQSPPMSLFSGGSFCDSVSDGLSIYSSSGFPSIWNFLTTMGIYAGSYHSIPEWIQIIDTCGFSCPDIVDCSYVQTQIDSFNAYPALSDSCAGFAWVSYLNMLSAGTSYNPNYTEWISLLNCCGLSPPACTFTPATYCDTLRTAYNTYKALKHRDTGYDPKWMFTTVLSNVTGYSSSDVNYWYNEFNDCGLACPEIISCNKIDSILNRIPEFFSAYSRDTCPPMAWASLLNTLSYTYTLNYDDYSWHQLLACCNITPPFWDSTLTHCDSLELTIGIYQSRKSVATYYNPVNLFEEVFYSTFHTWNSFTYWIDKLDTCSISCPELVSCTSINNVLNQIATTYPMFSRDSCPEFIWVRMLNNAVFGWNNYNATTWHQLLSCCGISPPVSGSIIYCDSIQIGLDIFEYYKNQESHPNTKAILEHHFANLFDWGHWDNTLMQWVNHDMLYWMEQFDSCNLSCGQIVSCSTLTNAIDSFISVYPTMADTVPSQIFEQFLNGNALGYWGGFNAAEWAALMRCCDISIPVIDYNTTYCDRLQAVATSFQQTREGVNADDDIRLFEQMFGMAISWGYQIPPIPLNIFYSYTYLDWYHQFDTCGLPCPQVVSCTLLGNALDSLFTVFPQYADSVPEFVLVNFLGNVTQANFENYEELLINLNCCDIPVPAVDSTAVWCDSLALLNYLADAYVLQYIDTCLPDWLVAGLYAQALQPDSFYSGEWWCAQMDSCGFSCPELCAPPTTLCDSIQQAWHFANLLMPTGIADDGDVMELFRNMLSILFGQDFSDGFPSEMTGQILTCLPTEFCPIVEETHSLFQNIYSFYPDSCVSPFTVELSMQLAMDAQLPYATWCEIFTNCNLPCPDTCSNSGNYCDKLKDVYILYRAIIDNTSLIGDTTSFLENMYAATFGYETDYYDIRGQLRLCDTTLICDSVQEMLSIIPHILSIGDTCLADWVLTGFLQGVTGGISHDYDTWCSMLAQCDVICPPACDTLPTLCDSLYYAISIYDTIVVLFRIEDTAQLAFNMSETLLGYPISIDSMRMLWAQCNNDSCAFIELVHANLDTIFSVYDSCVSKWTLEFGISFATEGSLTYQQLLALYGSCGFTMPDTCIAPLPATRCDSLLQMYELYRHILEVYDVDSYEQGLLEEMYEFAFHTTLSYAEIVAAVEGCNGVCDTIFMAQLMVNMNNYMGSHLLLPDSLMRDSVYAYLDSLYGAEPGSINWCDTLAHCGYPCPLDSGGFTFCDLVGYLPLCFSWGAYSMPEEHHAWYAVQLLNTVFGTNHSYDYWIPMLHGCGVWCVSGFTPPASLCDSMRMANNLTLWYLNRSGITPLHPGYEASYTGLFNTFSHYYPDTLTYSRIQEILDTCGITTSIDCNFLQLMSEAVMIGSLPPFIRIYLLTHYLNEIYDVHYSYEQWYAIYDSCDASWPIDNYPPVSLCDSVQAVHAAAISYLASGGITIGHSDFEIYYTLIFNQLMDYYPPDTFNYSRILVLLDSCGITFIPPDCDTVFINQLLAEIDAYLTESPWLKYDPALSDSINHHLNQLHGGAYPIDWCDSLQKCGKTCPPPLPSPSLCNKPIFIPMVIDTAWCDSISYEYAYYNAAARYEDYVRNLNRDFETAYIEKCLGAYKRESFELEHPNGEYHYTLYYFDQAGSLVKTVPPQGVDLVNQQHTLATLYAYNTLGQLVKQRTPDGGLSRFWYNRISQLTFSDNGKQRPHGRLSYTHYDALQRTIEVGELSGLSDSSYYAIQLLTDWGAIGSWYHTFTLPKTEVTRTFYDYPQLVSGIAQHNLRNRVASVTYEDADDADSLTYRFAAHYTYDVHGNVDTLIQENTRLHAIGHGYKRTAYNYDLISGKVNRADYQPGQPDRFTHRYEYDADNRILSAHTTRDGVIWEEDADYNYYKHGPLARMQMGERDVQGLDYVYTIQGWLKSVNSITLSETRDPGKDANNVFGNPNRYNGRDIFGFSLEYFNGDFQPIAWGAGGTITAANHYLADASAHLATGSLYNGNIAMIQQQVRNTGNPLLRKYGYDQLNRLASVNLFSGLDSAANSWTGATATDDYHEAFTYDANGNILTLIRNGLASQALAMDTFSYRYTPNTNRLDHVKDVVNAANYNIDIDNQDTTNYRYDAIGNLTKDISEGIDTILWTLYGKVAAVSKADSNLLIRFAYNPMGQRVEKEVIRNADTTKTLYVHDASGNIMAVYTLRNGDSLKLNDVPIYGSSRLGVWNANKLLRIDSVLHDTEIQAQDPQDPTTEGVTYIKAGEKQYSLSNHLDNVLATVSDRKIPVYDGGVLNHYQAEQITGNEYFAFGSLMPQRQFSIGGFRWSFNGKEFDIDINGRRNHYDYGFRILNTDLGKFLSVDPLFHSYPWLSTYQFAENSPIQFVDIDGRESGWIDVGMGRQYMGAGDLGNVYRRPLDIVVTPQPKVQVVQEQSFKLGGIAGSPEGQLYAINLKNAYEVSKYTPGTSDVHDAMDVATNLHQGNFKAAAFSTLFFIPGSDFFKLAKFVPLDSWAKYGVKTYDEFRELTKKLPANDRIAKFVEAGRDVAKNNGWQKNSKLSKMNDREVFEVLDNKGKIDSYRALDTEKGTFEILDKKGRHQGEANFEGIATATKGDNTGGHDIKLK